jgi:hypothetical protein
MMKPTLDTTTFGADHDKLEPTQFVLIKPKVNLDVIEHLNRFKMLARNKSERAALSSKLTKRSSSASRRLDKEVSKILTIQSEREIYEHMLTRSKVKPQRSKTPKDMRMKTLLFQEKMSGYKPSRTSP